jgi:AcrR family transcriptional regulator
MARTIQGDVKHRILAAAEERLWHYGFRKTTIDEIAADAGVGKGTVYLYFDSKEDIALAIMGQFKTASIERLEGIARSGEYGPVEKLTRMLTSPILTSHDVCGRSPGAQEMIVAVRPHIKSRLRPYLEQEIALLAEVIEQGIEERVFDVDDTLQCARSMKYMLTGFLPHYAIIEDRAELNLELERAVAILIRGIRKQPQ